MTIELMGFNDNFICSKEAVGLSKCFEALSKISEAVEAIGFNCKSGYVYIALENCITICSRIGNDVEYLVTDFDDGTEHFFDDYDLAIDFMSKM